MGSEDHDQFGWKKPLNRRIGVEEAAAASVASSHHMLCCYNGGMTHDLPSYRIDVIVKLFTYQIIPFPVNTFLMLCAVLQYYEK